MNKTQLITCFSKGIISPESCKAAIEALGVIIGNSSTVNDKTLPPGCLLSPLDAFNPVHQVIFNNLSTKIECGNSSSVALIGSVTIDKVFVQVQHNATEALILMEGTIYINIVTVHMYACNKLHYKIANQIFHL